MIQYTARLMTCQTFECLHLHHSSVSREACHCRHLSFCTSCEGSLDDELKRWTFLHGQINSLVGSEQAESWFLFCELSFWGQEGERSRLRRRQTVVLSEQSRAVIAETVRKASWVTRSQLGTQQTLLLSVGAVRSVKLKRFHLNLPLDYNTFW